MRYEANIAGMDCGSCAAKIERVVGGLDGVSEVSVDLTLARMWVELDREQTQATVDDTVRRLGYGIAPVAARRVVEETPMTRDPRLLAVVVGSLATILGLALDSIPAFVVAIVAGGIYVFRNALSSLRHLHLDIHVLMTIAVLGAMVIGEWFEAATVVVLFAFAEWLEGASMNRARRAIRDLMELAPPVATVLRHGVTADVPVESVAVGEVVVVLPGHKVPLDGAVSSGVSEVNQAALTGESTPVAKQVGDDVFAGTLNTTGTLHVAVSRRADDSTLAHVVQAIEAARDNRSESERFIERFARWYTPAVVVIAASIAIVPPLFLGEEWLPWFYRALVMLVIACPCALVIATPITTVSALARGARDGILIKGGRTLERLAQTKAVVFDKTGTLTVGRPVIGEILPADRADEVLSIASIAERQSEHAIARAIVAESAVRGLKPPSHRITRLQAHPGAGVEAHFEAQTEDDMAQPSDAPCCASGCADEHDHGHHHHDVHTPSAEVQPSVVLAGTRGLLEEFGIDHAGWVDAWQRLESRAATVVGVAKDGRFVGLVECRDQGRPDAAETLAQLRAMGVDRLKMCTGDNASAAQAIASEVGLHPDDVHAELFPADKVAVLETLRAEVDGALVMVGDGINDAPALAAADIGFAMGAVGTDLALESAHVALMDDRLELIPEAITLGRRTVRVIRQNIIFAIGTKILVFGLASAGVATLWMAIAADMGTSLVVIANGMRLLR